MDDFLSACIHFYTLGYVEMYLIPGIFLGVLDGVYTYVRSGRAIEHFGRNQKSVKSRILRLLFALLICSFCINVWAPAFQFVAFPLLVISLLLDVVAKVAGSIYHGVTKSAAPRSPVISVFSKGYWTGAFLAIVYACFLGWGYCNLTNVTNTEYTFSTDTVSQPLNILFISDTHYGTIEDPDELVTVVNQIKRNKTHYDAVVLGGDIVDERTSNENMNRAFDVLGQITSTYGTFFVYGNHDRQPNQLDLPLSGRSFTDDELCQACERNHIQILDDSAVDLGPFILAGREDYGWAGVEAARRISTQEILQNFDTNKLVVVVDHQAVDMEENANAGADLQLSGHSHGGQTWPFGLIQRYLLGLPVRGEFNYDGLTLFVSSGFAGWGVPLRDEGVSEYMTIHVQPEVNSATATASDGAQQSE